MVQVCVLQVLVGPGDINRHMSIKKKSKLKLDKKIEVKKTMPISCIYPMRKRKKGELTAPQCSP
jgi:hypothetical protein